MAPLKVRLVVDLVRGKPVPQALEILRFSPKRAAVYVGKVIRSAVANAVTQGDVDEADLVVARTWVGDGPRMRRFRPRSRGMAAPILKRFCHIEVILETVEASAAPVKGKSRKAAAEKVPATEKKSEIANKG